MEALTVQFWTVLLPLKILLKRRIIMDLMKDLLRISELPQIGSAHRKENNIYFSDSHITTSFGYTSWVNALLNRLPAREDEVKRLCEEAPHGINIIEGVCMAHPTDDTWTDTRFEIYVHYNPHTGYSYEAITYSTGHSLSNTVQAPDDCPVQSRKTDNLNAAFQFLIDKADDYTDERVDKQTIKNFLSGF